jgi:RNA polymerase sigma-70 factor (ECF subfamily)
VGDPDRYSDDAALVTALRAGDEDAFGWLLDRLDRPLRRLARTFVSTPAAADEVVQETWLAVLEGLDRFEQRSSVRTWVTRVLMNKARTRGTRDRRTVPFSSIEAPTFPPEAFRGPDDPDWPGHWVVPPRPWEQLPAEQVEGRETVACVRAAIEALPPLHRQVITLRDVEGWPAGEICAVLDLTPANQRVVLHRARARVRDAVASYLEQPVT